ncbi:MAG: L-serine ammonia-lyase, iron-sulfur-dependent, subunit alpha [Firmicutes bacterium]|nr:L-serine ammonia-lyase, iron-sulfur-dependent, subunit alpha [Bacillota bacterium]
MLEYNSIEAIVLEANRRNMTISQVVLEDQANELGVTEENILARMADTLEIMRNAAQAGFKPGLRSNSGLTGGDGYRMKEYTAQGLSLSGSFCAKAISLALAIQEYNAAMGKIVAAPTAGSCGILPAGILTMIDERGIKDEQAILALITAGAIGLVIAGEATIAGAEGGCQAECGSAAAMTAGALVEMAGGDNEKVAQACAIALKNQLGLVCDPVAGLVEVPCIKRNAGGIMCAIGAADMALAGIKSVIPVDEVIAALAEVGESLPITLKETAQGGLAATPTAIAIKERIFGR